LYFSALHTSFILFPRPILSPLLPRPLLPLLQSHAVPPTWGISGAPPPEFPNFGDLFSGFQASAAAAYGHPGAPSGGTGPGGTKVLAGPRGEVRGSFTAERGFALEDGHRTAAEDASDRTSRNRESSSDAAAQKPRLAPARDLEPQAGGFFDQADNRAEAILEPFESWRRASGNPSPQAFKVQAKT
jgi:hypothetical protein